MNEILQTKILPTTQGAAGVPRLRWTLAEFERLAELGFFTDEDHIELIGGELVPMAPRTACHETVRGDLLNSRAMRCLPQEVLTAGPLGWRVNEDTYLEPDCSSTPTLAGAKFPRCRRRRCCF